MKKNKTSKRKKRNANDKAEGQPIASSQVCNNPNPPSNCEDNRSNSTKNDSNKKGRWTMDRAVAISQLVVALATAGTLYVVYRQAQTMEQQLIYQSRAYVTPTNMQSSGKGPVLNIEFTLENFGPTPAKNCSIRGDAKILPFPLPAKYDFQIPDNPIVQKSRIDPRQEGVASQYKVHKSYTFNSTKAVDILSADNDRRVYVFGVLTYDDIFGNAHFTNFCSFLTFDVTPKKDGNGRPVKTFAWMDCGQHTDFN